jgi:Tfp pilus assembly protein PilF
MRPIKLSILFFILLTAGCVTTGQKSVPPPEPVAPAPVQKVVLTDAQRAEYQRAVELLKSADINAAETAFNALSKALPNSAGVFANLGIIAAAKNDEPAAIGYYEKSLTLNPGYLVSLNNLGNIWMKQGKFKEAETLYLQAHKTDAGNTSVLLNLALLNELYMHDLNAAIRYYQQYQSVIGTPDEAIAGRISDIQRRLN